MIQVFDYYKVYRDLVAVSGLSFEVRDGAILGLVGPNGAGKTTTLRALAGIIPPTGGRLLIAGQDIVAESVAAKRQLAYIPDDPKLFDTLTVWEHLRFIASAYCVENWEPKGEEFLDIFELVEKRDTVTQELSRGMRQKVAIACAYLHDPQVILFDEPLTGLDPHAIRTLKSTIVARAAEGASVIVSSHLLSLVENLCTDLLILRRGKSLFCGPVQEARSGLGRLARNRWKTYSSGQSKSRKPRSSALLNRGNAMNRSLLLLSKLRFLGQVRRARRTLLTPRGFVSGLLAIGFFSLILLPYLVTRNLPRAVPQEHLPLATWFLHPASLFGFWVFNFAGSHFRSPIAFSMPEVEFLFPGPFGRQELLIYKLAASLLGTFGFAVMTPLILPMIWGPAALVGIWLALTFMQWSSILVTLGANLLGARFRLALISVVLALVSVVGFSIWKAGVFEAGLSMRERLTGVESTLICRAVLAPFGVFSCVMRSEAYSELASWAMPALAINVCVAVAILALDQGFLEASLEASQRRHQVLERLKRTGGVPSIGARSKPRLGLPMYPRLLGAGTIAWRQSLEMVRSSGRLLLVLPAVVGPFAAIVLSTSKRAGSSVEIMIFALVLTTGFMVTTMLQLGLRTDLDHVDVIKTLPLSSQRIVWGSVGASVLYLTLVQIIVAGAMLAAVGRWVPMAAAAIAVAVPVNVLFVAIDSALVIVFPSARRFMPGDLLAGIRLMLVNFVKFATAIVAVGIAGAVVAALYFLFRGLPIVAYLAGWCVLCIEGLFTVLVAAWLFQHYDPSEQVTEAE